jgi:hypothetical protein
MHSLAPQALLVLVLVIHILATCDLSRTPSSSDPDASAQQTRGPLHTPDGFGESILVVWRCCLNGDGCISEYAGHACPAKPFNPWMFLKSSCSLAEPTIMPWSPTTSPSNAPQDQSAMRRRSACISGPVNGPLRSPTFESLLITSPPPIVYISCCKHP